jgi:hypothetical protein
MMMKNLFAAEAAYVSHAVACLLADLGLDVATVCSERSVEDHFVSLENATSFITKQRSPACP